MSITSIIAQDMKVTRSQLIPWGSPVTNITVDAENIKWVGHDGKLAKIYGLGLAANDGLAEGEKSLALYRGGNADIRWNSGSLIQVTGDIFDEYNYLTSGAYDEQKNEMWLGTSQTGVFRIKVSDSGLQLMEQMTTGSSRLRSNQINDILIDERGRVWIGTYDGLLLIENGKENILEKNLIFESVAANASGIWLMGDNLLGKLSSRGDWEVIDIPARRTEGDLKDIALDGQGNVWIASEVITRYNPETDTYTVFGPAQEYTSQFATAISVDQDGAVWVGTRDKGLYVIQEADAFVAFCEIDTPVGCNGNGQDGALSVRVDGGTPPYNYEWSAGLSGQNPTGLSPGTYDVTVTDSKGNVATSSATFMDLSVKITVSQDQPADNDAANGVATVTVQQGQPEYSYKWDSGEATATATALNPGTHTVTVTDKNGCEATASVEITEALAAFTVEAETTDISCAGGADATIELAVSGGQQPYTYQWNQEGLSGDQATGLGEGTYEVVVSDAAGNKKSILRNIIEPEGMNLRTQMSAPATTGNSDGEANVRVRSGGQEPYSYNWDSGEATQQATQLSPGTHTVTVTDANGCTATATVEVTENILPLQLSLEQSSTINCFDGADARLEAIVDGGKPPYTYQWEGATAEGAIAEGLREGQYALVVIDDAGQQARDEIVINQPALLTANAVVESPASTGNNDGQASIQASGGTSPYQYQWDNGETEALAKQLSPGTHSFTVTDANACSATATVEITEDILPLQLSLELSSEVNCFDGADARLEANLQGGKPPYTYQWEGTSAEGELAEDLKEGTYALVVVDDAGQRARAEMIINQPEQLTANAVVESPASTGNSDGQASIQASGGTSPYQYQWDSGETEALAKQLSPGTHSFTVTDANACSATGTVEITEDILPLQLALNAVKTLDCNGDSDAELSVEVRGGKPPYQYEWEGQESTAASIAGLGEGTYAVVVQDASGLEVRKQGEVSAPPALDIAATADAPANTGQSDGRASVQAQGGTAPYTYRWDNGETTAAVNNLNPGNHAITVTDANACTATASVEIGEDIQPLSVSINILQPVSCNESSDASLEAEVRGGKPPYTYRWVETSGAEKELSGLTAGEYTLFVQDASGLEQESSITIEAPPALQLSVTLRSPASTGNADGVAMAEVSGGTPPYTYSWTGGATQDIAEGLSPGRKSVTVTDANGCEVQGEVEVNENILPLQLAIEEVQPVRCKDGDEGKLLAKVSGGKPPYYYNWSHNSLNSEEASALVAGEYSLTVTDVEETEKVITYQLAEPDKLTLTATVLSPASTGASDGKAKVTAAGGTGAYNYEWQSGATTPTAENLSPGFHRVVVTDERGCEASTNFEVTENILPLELALALEKPLSCAGQDDAVVQARVNGGKPPYEYQWNTEGLSGERLSELGAGTYTLTVTDVLGTTQGASLEVPALEPLSINLVENIPAFGESTNDGEAKAVASGGTPPYQFAWDTGAGGAAVEGLAIGNHSVTVTDQNGCTASAEFETAERIMKELASGAVSSGQTMNIQKLQFDADSTKIRADARPVLNEIFQFLEQNPTIVVEIGGHTNNLPPPEYCDSLSTARARAVAEYLVRKGIASERVFYQGYGKRDPLFSNKTADGRRRNQRVEIKILRL